jgi:oligopeptidase A
MQPFLKNDFLFDWSQLRVEAVESDIRAALKIAQENIEKFKALPPAQLDYAKVMLGFENTTRDLSRAWGLVSHLDSVMNSPELRKAYNALLPEVTAFYTALTLDPEIWKIFKAYAATAEAKALTGVRQRFLKEALLDFEENGADLAAEQKARLTEVNARLAEKTQKYSENVLDSTNDWDLFITDEKRLVGLPASALAAAKQSAIAKERPDAWRITLQQPSIFPVLQYGEDASLRQQCWEALTQVGLKGKWDNTSLVAEILALRDEKALSLIHI